MGTIVVGVDESDGAGAALRWAVEEAQLHRWSLAATMCWLYFGQHQGPGQARDFDPAYDEAAARRALDAIIDAAVGDAGIPIERRLVNDLASRGLLESADDADLLVLGARGLGGFRTLVMGSVSQQCLYHASVPVAIVRSVSTRTDRRDRIVVGVDGSETAQRALQWAVDEARLRRATVEAVHAWTLPYLGSPYVPDMASFEQIGENVLERAVDAVDASGVDRPVVRSVVFGSGGAVLVDAAERADLVVVGSRGFGGFKGLLLGSVSHQVSHHAPCPVVVIPPTPRTDSGIAEPSGRSRPAELSR